MKKITLILMLVIAALGMTASAKSERIDASQVPAPLKAFVEQHFGKDVSIVSAERERQHGGYEYDVTLSNSCEIDYGVSQQWEEVEINKGSLPASLVGEAITNDIAVKYPNMTIKKIERKPFGYEVKLNNGLELQYNKAFKFIGVDK